MEGDFVNCGAVIITALAVRGNVFVEAPGPHKQVAKNGKSLLSKHLYVSERATKNAPQMRV